MKYLVAFALVALVAARPEGGDKADGEDRKPKGPAIIVRPVHRAAQNESYEFKFAIAGMEELDESEVSLWKVVRGEEGPELAETDFDVELKTLTEDEITQMIEEKKEKLKEILERLEEKREEIKEWLKEKKGDIKEWIEEKKEAIRERIGDEKFEMLQEWIAEKKEAIKEWIENKKAEREGDAEKGDDRRPHPRPKHVIVGKVTVSGVTCEDQRPYLIRYGSKGEEKEAQAEGQDGESRRRPRKPRGAFLLLVKGCKRPEPKED